MFISRESLYLESVCFLTTMVGVFSVLFRNKIIEFLVYMHPCFIDFSLNSIYKIMNDNKKDISTCVDIEQKNLSDKMQNQVI
jgi:hypothetical protein